MFHFVQRRRCFFEPITGISEDLLHQGQMLDHLVKSLGPVANLGNGLVREGHSLEDGDGRRHNAERVHLNDHTYLAACRGKSTDA